MNPEIYGCTLIHASNDKNKGNLYVGGIKSLQYIKQNKFGAIISAVETLDEKIPNYVHHLRIEAFDEPNFDLMAHFEKTNKFVKLYLPKTNVLIHCQVGVSRSVSIMIAYFIKELKMKPDEALNYIKQKRDFVHPNEGFQLQLQKYYEQCKQLPQQDNKLQKKK